MGVHLLFTFVCDTAQICFVCFSVRELDFITERAGAEPWDPAIPSSPTAQAEAGELMRRAQAFLASEELTPTVACLQSEPACWYPLLSPQPQGKALGLLICLKAKPNQRGLLLGRCRDLEEMLSHSQLSIKAGGLGMVEPHEPSACPLLSPARTPTLLASALTPPPMLGMVMSPASQGGGSGLDQCPIEGGLSGWERHFPVLTGAQLLSAAPICCLSLSLRDRLGSQQPPRCSLPASGQHYRNTHAHTAH